MTFGKNIYGDYERFIIQCRNLAAEIPAVPIYGGPFDPLSVARKPELLTLMAANALREGKRKVDAQRELTIQNNVDSHIRDNPLFRLPIKPSPFQPPAATPTPLRPMTPQSLTVYITPVEVPELGFLEKCVAYCYKRTAYLRALNSATRKWDEWTDEIADFYKTGIVKDNDGELQAIERTADGKGRQIKRQYLAAYFTEAKNAGLFSNKNATSRTVEESKRRLATNGNKIVADVVSAAERNNFGGATTSLERRISAFEHTRSTINGYHCELYEYINLTTSCSTNVLIDPVSLNYWPKRGR